MKKFGSSKNLVINLNQLIYIQGIRLSEYTQSLLFNRCRLVLNQHPLTITQNSLMIIDYAYHPHCAKKKLTLTVAFCTAMEISYCIASPAVQNKQFCSPANKDNSSNSSSASIDVSDLNNRDSSYAIQQLRKRGFYQVGARLSKSWWIFQTLFNAFSSKLLTAR